MKFINWERKGNFNNITYILQCVVYVYLKRKTFNTHIECFLQFSQVLTRKYALYCRWRYYHVD